MANRVRRRFTPGHESQTDARLPEPGAICADLAGEPGVTQTQPKTWKREFDAAGSPTAIAAQRSTAPALAQHRRDN